MFGGCRGVGVVEFSVYKFTFMGGGGLLAVTGVLALKMVFCLHVFSFCIRIRLCQLVVSPVVWAFNLDYL